MKIFQRIGLNTGGSGLPGGLVSAFAVAAMLGGCSADVGRFDFPSFNLNGNSGATGTIPTPAEPMTAGGSSLSGAADRSSDRYGGGSYVPPRAGTGNGSVDVAALSPPPVAEPLPDTYSSRRASAPMARPSGRDSSAETSPSGAGDSIDVQRGDTLYGIARRHGVTVKDLMAANGLQTANIKPGQKLRLPGGGVQPSTVAAAPEPRQEPSRNRAAVAAAPSAATSDWGGSYKVQAGDSLYGIARAHKVRVADLQNANNITNPREMRPGITLRVPGTGGGAPAPAAVAEASRGLNSPASEPVSAPRVIQSTTQPTVINSERQVAALNTGRIVDAPAQEAQSAASGQDAKAVKTVAVSPLQIGGGKLRWPSKGKIISGFGQRPDGTHNDGVNIAVPQGTDVHVAETGEVAYAGSELKGYGNLILVRHDNGWVTAYAHTDQMLVKRGDKVRRGDVIAKAGKTGQVDQPQLHFELRQGSKPVDPLPYLDRL